VCALVGQVKDFGVIKFRGGSERGRYGRYEKSSKTFVEKSGNNIPFERPRQTYEIILKLVVPIIHTAREGVDWTDLNQNSGQERYLVYQGDFVTGLAVTQKDSGAI